ncbi:MAG: cytochrome c/FTR1 family iron permease [Gallionella sp.]
MCSIAFRRLPAVFTILLLILMTTPVHAEIDDHSETDSYSVSDAALDRDVQSILHMLDYLSVDYGGAVLFGRILNSGEYLEQAEFAGQALKLINLLPYQPILPELIEDARELARNVGDKANAEIISASAQKLRREIITIYKVPVSPRKIPDAQRAEFLYRQLCVKCHGPDGYGDGPESLKISQKPQNFHDVTRMAKRSVYGLYSTISLGVAGTPMTGFPQLPEEERWGLAFYVSNLHNDPSRVDLGRRLWERRDFQGAIPNLVALSTLTPNEIGIKYGDNTRAVFEFLRSQPDALFSTRHATLAFSTQQLDKSLSEYRNGNKDGALGFAIAAYLEGFEPMEISLINLNAELRLDIEQQMMAIRQAISVGAPSDELAAKIELAKAKLGQADELLREGKLSITGAFVSSLFILLREGLEGILVLAAVIAFVIKSGQRQVLPYIHAGWGGAIVLGLLTWAAAAWLIDISGAGREITSGVTALVASAMLIYVGFWLHDKQKAEVWKTYLQDKVGNALEQKTVWTLTLISFFAIYREIFETVLFYEALWTQTTVGTRPALWSGLLAGSLTLAVVGWGLFRFGLRLPLGKFFSAASLLLGVLAVIFAGQGVASLQDAGIVAISRVNFISLPILGVLPTWQTLLAQAAVIGILIFTYSVPFVRRRSEG